MADGFSKRLKICIGSNGNKPTSKIVANELIVSYENNSNYEPVVYFVDNLTLNAFFHLVIRSNLKSNRVEAIEIRKGMLASFVW